MCGRYQLVRPELLAKVYGLEQHTLDALALAPNMNVRPTQTVPVLLGEHDAHELAVMRWGLIPPWAKDAAARSSTRGPRASPRSRASGAPSAHSAASSLPAASTRGKPA